MRGLVLCLIVTVACFGTAGCGSGSESSSGLSGSSSNPSATQILSFTTRQKVLNQIAEFRDTLTLQDPVADRDALLAYLKTIPEISEAGNVDLDVWGHFSDGRTVCIPLSYADTLESQGFQTLQFRANVEPEKVRARAGDDNRGDANPPSNGLIELMVGDSFPDTTARAIARKFQHAGYHGVLEALTLAHVEALTNLSFLYLDCHAGRFVGRSGSHLGAVIVDDPVEDQLDTRYLADLQDDGLVYMIRPPASDLRQLGITHRATTRYGVTGIFFQHHAEFRQNSLAFVNACTSDSQADSSLKNGMFAAGASNYLGWTKEVVEVDAGQTSQFLVDRLLGQSFEPFLPETPLQRPFDFPAVFAHLLTRPRGATLTTLGESHLGANLYLEPFGDLDLSRLRSTPNPSASSHFRFFVPCLQRVEVDEVNHVLRLVGVFPTNPLSGDKVLLGNTELSVLSWASDEIRCTIPATGGGLVRMSSDGIQSNPVPLTEWTVTPTIDSELDATYVYAPPSTVNKTITDVGSTIMTGSVAFRADVHGYRDAPGGALNYGTATGTESNSSVTSRTGTRVTDNEYVPSGSLIYTYTPNSNLTGRGDGALYISGTDLNALTVTGTLALRIADGWTIHPDETPPRVPPLGSF